MPGVLDEALSVDEERGVITLKGQRYWLAKSEEFVSMQKVLERLMGKAAAGALYREGEDDAQAYMASIRIVMGPSTDRGSPRGLLESYLAFLRSIGYGRFEITAWGEGSAAIRLHEGIASESYGPSTKPVCHYLAGFLAGLFREAWKSHGKDLEARAVEVRCRSTGSEVCEFAIGPTKLP